jgi:hypothetical protein
MGDTVFINVRAAVHKGNAGQAMAFPDVCLCPPTPPAGPVPIPLPNMVMAADMDGGAGAVSCEGNPMGKKSSFFKKSTGNEVAQSTGGGVVSHVVQGKAYFQSYSMDVMIEDEKTVRHADLLTHNHAAQPGNTPPVPWMSTMSPPPSPPSATVAELKDKKWIGIKLTDDDGNPVPGARYDVKLPDGTTRSGRLGPDGTAYVRAIPEGDCEVTFPDVDGESWKPA